MYADRLFNAMERNQPAPGMLLIAAPSMEDPVFARSVILLLEHNEATTFGVNLASRSDVAVFNVMPEWAPLVSKPQALYIGGPLNQQGVIGIGVSAPGVDIVSHPHFNRLANRLLHVDLRTQPEDVAADLSGLRLFAGYAEWEPGQLNEEIEKGEWYVAPALSSDVTAAGNVDVWGDVMRRQPMPLPLYSTYPMDVSEN
ncbi:YqgE/AlgH family protein [Corynebacterium pseudotuberculosis 258]|uniref:YqgE/AlgH family protein n=1 Tax=Corynebacterium pseudotuberculosis 258 TaxID=1168865 RepID=A0AAU8QIJ0_CORPS|nr:YqgE/AlgH family protein [Corynebacterium pseudotuberculosis]AEQ07612.1 YqgE/AlgH family protein [Corynebacterium pseudotuberculosis CIP 52.97]AFK17728.1 YqgE/AlgH family protein [Corynebacterium pseudotuberculosis 258]